jgi:tripartite ATP-independent transporter DctP family solute receptor
MLLIIYNIKLEDLMKKTFLFVLCLMILAVSIWAGGSQEAAPAPAAAPAVEKPIELSLGHMNATVTRIHKWCLKFKELVELKTDGRLIINVYPAAQLGNDEQNLEGLKHGTLDIAKSNPETTSVIAPEWAAFSLPFLFKSFEQVEAAMDGEPGDMLEKILLDEHGIRTLAWVHNGFREMLTVKKPVLTLEDFKGVKFRSPPIPVYVMMFEALGASPTPIPWPEVYSAMKSNLADGLETTPEGMWDYKMYEVTNYVTITNHLYTCDTLLMRDESLKALPADLQKALLEAAVEMEQWGRELVIGENELVYDRLRGTGITINELSLAERTKIQNACLPVWQKLATTYNAPVIMEIAKKIADLGN